MIYRGDEAYAKSELEEFFRSNSLRAIRLQSHDTLRNRANNSRDLFLVSFFNYVTTAVAHFICLEMGNLIDTL